MTLRTVVKNLLKEGYSGNAIQKMLPNYGFKKRRQDLQEIIRDIRNIKKKISSKPWEGLPQPIIKPRSKLEHWKRVVSTSLRYTNVFYNYYITFLVTWIDEIGFYHTEFFTKFLGLMNFIRFKQEKERLIAKAEEELLEDLAQSLTYEEKRSIDIIEIRLIEVFRHKRGILK